MKKDLSAPYNSRISPLRKLPFIPGPPIPLSPFAIPAGLSDPYNSRKLHFRKKKHSIRAHQSPFPLCRFRRGLAIPITHGNSTSGKKHSIRDHKSPFPDFPIPAGVGAPFYSPNLPPPEKTLHP